MSVFCCNYSANKCQQFGPKRKETFQTEPLSFLILSNLMSDVEIVGQIERSL